MKKPYLLIITAILYLVLTGGMSLAKDSDVESIEECKQVVTINPDFEWAHSKLGLAYLKSGMHKEAIRINPDDAYTYFGLGAVYGTLGMHEKAIEAYKQAIRINPDFALAHYNLGYAYVLLNDRSSALEHYKVLKSLDSEMANELFDYINK